MDKFICKNFGSCPYADHQTEFSLPPGAEGKCPECGSSVKEVGSQTGMHPVNPQSGDTSLSKQVSPRTTRVDQIVLAVILVIAVSLGAWWGVSRYLSTTETADLYPDPSPKDEQTSARRSRDSAPSQPAYSASADERAPRMLCDQATKDKSAAADAACNHAAAVTLMNAGALATRNNNLPQAEKDYLAALVKDPNYARLYFNIAVLKAMQGKKQEALDNLAMAERRKFGEFDMIKGEPALLRLKLDPALKPEIEKYEALGTQRRSTP